jgi:hypothetical protein
MLRKETGLKAQTHAALSKTDTSASEYDATRCSYGAVTPPTPVASTNVAIATQVIVSAMPECDFLKDATTARCCRRGVPVHERVWGWGWVQCSLIERTFE